MEKNQQGFSLMEVLVSVVIMSIGLLAILKMQLLALQASNSAFNTSIAMIRLESLHSMLVLNPTNMPELLANWTEENKVWLPESKTEQMDKQIRIVWYDTYTKQNILTTITSSFSVSDSNS